MDLKRYRELLAELDKHLSGFGERRWSSRIEGWVSEIDNLSAEQLLAHLSRTRKALFGMGSIADIMISPEAGLSIPNNEKEIEMANGKLISLARAIDQEIETLVGETHAKQ